jgi:hypothetical protein
MEKSGESLAWPEKSAASQEILNFKYNPEMLTPEVRFRFANDFGSSGWQIYCAAYDKAQDCSIYDLKFAPSSCFDRKLLRGSAWKSHPRHPASLRRF